jgi:hypothetical protein
LRSTVELIEVILIPLLFIAGLAHELHGVVGVSAIEIMDSGSLGGVGPRVASRSADLLGATIGPSSEVRNGHITRKRSALAGGLLMGSPSDVVTSFEVISVDLNFDGLTVVSIESVGLLSLVVVPSSGHDLVRMALDLIDSSAELSGPRRRILCRKGEGASKSKQSEDKNESLHYGRVHA